MMEGPRHQHLHQEWQEPLEERGGEGGVMPMRQRDGHYWELGAPGEIWTELAWEAL